MKKQITTLALFASSLLAGGNYYGGDNIVIPPPSINVDETNSVYQFDGDTYFKFALGMSKINLNADTVSQAREELSDDTSILLTTSVGHKVYDEYIVFVGMDNSKFTLSQLTNIYVGISYEFDQNEYDLTPYLGVAFGYSRLMWDDDPIIKPLETISTSESLLASILGGVEYKIDDKLSATIDIEVSMMDHQTYINSNLLDTTIQTNVSLGLKYYF